MPITDAVAGLENVGNCRVEVADQPWCAAVAMLMEPIEDRTLGEHGQRIGIAAAQIAIAAFRAFPLGHPRRMKNPLSSLRPRAEVRHG
jgi:hypothetical protein